MSARKVEILPKVRVVDSLSGVSGVTDGELKSSILVSNSPVVKNDLKRLIEQIFQFVTVGGDFA